MAKIPSYIAGEFKTDDITVVDDAVVGGDASIGGNATIVGSVTATGVFNAPFGKLTCTVASAAKTLTADEQANSIFVCTGHATNALILDMADGRFVIVTAVTTGVVVKNKSAATGVTVAAGKTACFYTSGNDVVRVSTDA